MFDDLFLDPILRLVCSAEGDQPPGEGAGGGVAPAPGGGTPPPDKRTSEPPEGSGEPPSDPLPSDPDTTRSAGWTKEALEKQVARQHRKMKELEAQVQRAAELEAENKRLKELAEAAARRPEPSEPPPAPSAKPPPPVLTAPPDEAAMRAKVRMEIQLEQLTEALKTTYAEDWKVAYENYTKVGGLNEDLMGQILATDDPAHVIIALGKDPSKLQDVLDMSGAKRQAALIKMAMEKAAASAPEVRKPSAAPPPPPSDYQRGGPPPPVGGINLYDPQLASEDADPTWYTERLRQKRESKGRPWSIAR